MPHIATYFKLRHVSHIVQCLVALGFLLPTCRASAAAALFTSVLDIETANPGKPLSALQCNIVNVSNKPRTWTISIIGAVQPGSERAIASAFFLTRLRLPLLIVKLLSPTLPLRPSAVHLR